MKKLVLSLLFVAATLTTVNASATFDNTPTTTTEIAVPEVNAFCLAIVKGDTEMVKRLIALGQDVNEKSNGKTPAMYAARYNKVEILKLLVDNGAKLSTKCSKGHTAKDYAKISNAIEALKYLEDAA